MVFYESHTIVGLITSGLPAIASLYFFFVKNNKGLGIGFLLAAAFWIRVHMALLDPYVHEWDERFHALVAKNMIDDPFKPMLFKEHVLPYKLEEWSYNHIWVHKQPLFLWQMALSMKVLGVNTFAARFPSIILGSLLIIIVFDIGRKWLKNDNVAYVGAFIAAFSYYPLELVSGWISLDHNDLTFLFYITCSFWAIIKFIESGFRLKWALILGVFVGLSILNKWLVGLLGYGGLGLYLLLDKKLFLPKILINFSLSVLITGIIVLPWQIYILHQFPSEAAVAFEYNRRHITEDLGHPGSVFFHFQFLRIAYSILLLLFLPIGIWRVFKDAKINTRMTFSFVAMIVVLFSFFSFFVKTKMPAFVYPASSLLVLFMAYGLVWSLTKAIEYLGIEPRKIAAIYIPILILIGIVALKPVKIIDQRSILNVARGNKIHNSEVYKNINDEKINSKIVFNCKSFENIEMMFYKDVLAYHWYPEPNVIDSLLISGQKLVFFKNNITQPLPDYILNKPNVEFINDTIR